MDDTSDLIPLSALQHWTYCPRRWALIHLERAFEDNLYPQHGQAAHAGFDQPSSWEQGAASPLATRALDWHRPHIAHTNKSAALYGCLCHSTFVASSPMPARFIHNKNQQIRQARS